MPLPYPTTSTKIGIREYVELETDSRFTQKPQKFRRTGAELELEQPPCFDQWKEQTYETTHKQMFKHPKRQGGIIYNRVMGTSTLGASGSVAASSVAAGEENEINNEFSNDTSTQQQQRTHSAPAGGSTGTASKFKKWETTMEARPGEAYSSYVASAHEQYSKAPTADRVVYLPPVGVVSMPQRSASRWISRSHETHSQPILEPPVAKVEAKLAREPMLAPCGTLLEVGEPLRSTTYRELFQEPDRSAVAQHLLRCKTSSNAFQPDTEGEVAVAKPKNDPTPLGFTYVRGPGGDRQVIDLCDTASAELVDRSTIRQRPETFQPTTAQQVKYLPHVLRSTYSQRMTDPMRDHEHVVRSAAIVAQNVLDSNFSKTQQLQESLNFDRYTVPRVFLIKDGEPTMDRAVELSTAKQRARGETRNIPRSKICSVGELLKYRVPQPYVVAE